VLRCQAVRFDRYGSPEVLKLEEVDLPDPAPGHALVRIRAAGLNPGESKIRSGMLEAIFPTTFPSGEGSDLAGVVEAVGADVSSLSPGDEVVGWSDERSSHAEAAVIPASQLVPKPAGVAWEVAGALPVVGTTAFAAVSAVDPAPGEVVVVAGAAGAVGGIASQLARRRGARVIGIAGADQHSWLEGLGVEPVSPGDGLAERLEAMAGRIDAFVDTVGAGYVQLAIELGVAPERIDTIIDFAAAQQYGVHSDGNAAGASQGVLTELLTLLDGGELELPIARTFPLSEVRAAYEYLEGPHGRGKVVLTIP
jgi:NADPH:quinone reductase-like Zn-dependent oxidoreductase